MPSQSNGSEITKTGKLMVWKSYRWLRDMSDRGFFLSASYSGRTKECLRWFVWFLCSAVDLASVIVHFQNCIDKLSWFWCQIVRRCILYSTNLCFRWLAEPAIGKSGSIFCNPGYIDKEWYTQFANTTLPTHLTAFRDNVDLYYLVHPSSYDNARIAAGTMWYRLQTWRNAIRYRWEKTNAFARAWTNKPKLWKYCLVAEFITLRDKAETLGVSIATKLISISRKQSVEIVTAKWPGHYLQWNATSH